MHNTTSGTGNFSRLWAACAVVCAATYQTSMGGHLNLWQQLTSTAAHRDLDTLPTGLQDQRLTFSLVLAGESQAHTNAPWHRRSGDAACSEIVHISCREPTNSKGHASVQDKRQPRSSLLWLFAKEVDRPTTIRTNRGEATIILLTLPSLTAVDDCQQDLLWLRFVLSNAFSTCTPPRTT